MISIKKIAVTLGLSAALAVSGFTMSASATDDTAAAPYVVVAWNVENPEDIWTPPQTLFTYTESAVADLTVLDSQLLPGECYQIDIYNNSEITASLIAAGVLTAPNQPQEDLIAGGDGVAYTVKCIDPLPPVEPPVEEPPVVVPEPPVSADISVPTLANTGADTGGYILLAGGSGILLLVGVVLYRLRKLF